MKRITIGILVPAVMLTCSAFGDLVQAPWPTSGGAEENLYQILGFSDNTALNNAIVNQSGGSFTSFEISASTLAGYSSLLLEMAGNADNNTFGLYEVGNTGNALQLLNGANGPNLNPADAVHITATAFAGNVIISDGAGSITVSSSATIGFYLNTGAGGNGTYYSDLTDENNANGNSMQHVAAFNVLSTLYGQAPFPTVGQSGYVMGWEDEPVGSSDFDYQDMVVSLTALPVPEPTTLVAGALLLLPFGMSTLRVFRKSRMA